MNLRISMLFAGLMAGVLPAQTLARSQAGAPASAAVTTGGAAPAQATGASSTPAATATSAQGTSAQGGTQRGTSSGGGRTSGAGRSSRNGTRSSSGGGNGPALPPAAAANGNVEVTGFPAQNAKGSADRPLLPIASPGNALGIRSGTPIVVRLQAAVDSGHAHNGDMLDGTLAQPLANLPAGTPVRLTVVQSVQAGRLYSFGELSIQVVSIANRQVLSDTVTAQGKEGAKEVPDAAPARGTEATFTPEQNISLPAA